MDLRRRVTAALMMRSTVSEPSSGVDDARRARQQREGNLWLHNSTSAAAAPAQRRRDRVGAHVPLLPSVADALSNDFLDLWIADFAVAGRLHPLGDKAAAAQSLKTIQQLRM